MTDARTTAGQLWSQYDDCRLCGAKAGEPCLDTRGYISGDITLLYRKLRRPHYGKRKLLFRTYRGKKILQ